MAMAKKRTVNWDDVPDHRAVIDAQLVHLRIVKCEILKTKKGSKYMPTVSFRVVKGQQQGVVGAPLIDYFALGTDDDPAFTDPATRTPALSRLKKLVKKSGAKLLSNLEKQLSGLVGKSVGAEVDMQIDDGLRDPKYKGAKRNNISDYFAIGERPLGKGKVEEEEEEEEEEGEEKEEEDDEEDEEEDDEDD
jgi:hypothetical protein